MPTPSTSDVSLRPRLGRAVWVTAAALVVARSLVWVFWEQSHFDSDQAVIGLMAKNLSQLRALPLLFYGQHYMLAVESWLAAPVFLLFGVSVATLKLPLLAINIAIAFLLLRILMRDVGLTRGYAVVASLFFLLPSPIIASRLVEAQGGNIEPFLYTMLLWLTRANPVAFGLIAGVGCLHREFTAYAVIAIVLLEALHGTLFTRANLRAKLIVLAEIAAVVLLVRFLMGHAALLGPGTAGSFPPDVASGQTKFWLSRFCWSPAALGGNLTWLFQQNLGTLLGWREQPLSGYVNSATVGGHGWVLVPMAALVLSAGAALVTGRRAAGVAPEGRPAVLPGRAFPAYLAIVGLLALAVYSMLGCGVQDSMLIRYTLLGLLIPVALAAAVLRVTGAGFAKAIAVTAVLACTAASAWDNARVLNEFIRHPPHSDYRELADRLEQEGVRYGRGGYWTAYHIDFLTNERVILASTGKVRIKEYQTIVDQHENESASIYFDDPCRRPSDDGINFGRWCIGNITRARHPVADGPKKLP